MHASHHGPGLAQRRVVPSPEPQRILEILPVTWLLDQGAVVSCAGGGGIPTTHPSGSGALVGIEAVIDKDLASELLAENVAADLFLMATDVDDVYLHWGSPERTRLNRVTPEDLSGIGTTVVGPDGVNDAPTPKRAQAIVEPSGTSGGSHPPVGCAG